MADMGGELEGNGNCCVPGGRDAVWTGVSVVFTGRGVQLATQRRGGGQLGVRQKGVVVVVNRPTEALDLIL